jgi:hypothetical protein
MGNQVYDLVETIPFKEGLGLGSIDDPVILTLPARATFPGSRADFYLGNAHPNPFTNETSFHYFLPEESNVSLNVYSIAGQLLKSYVPRIEGAGLHQFVIISLEQGAGIYFYLLEARTKTTTYRAAKRLVQLR